MFFAATGAYLRRGLTGWPPIGLSAQRPRRLILRPRYTRMRLRLLRHRFRRRRWRQCCEEFRAEHRAREKRAEAVFAAVFGGALLSRIHEAREGAAERGHEGRDEFGRIVGHVAVFVRGNLFLLCLAAFLLFLATRFRLQKTRAAYFAGLGGGSAARPACCCRSASRRSSSTCSSNRAARAESSA